MELHLPEQVTHMINRLSAHGYRAYAVGGCVRDSLCGAVPSDWDVATSALPQQVKAVFSGEKLIETGLQHGTVTVFLDGMPIEVTTFRQDGNYSDHRRPDSVSFSDDIRTDLSRRDFTINAMAYHPTEGLIDPFGGVRDLSAGRIRCVGDPAARFEEDALRIMRALRFAAVLRFDLDEATYIAMQRKKDLLQYVSPERIMAELRRMLCGNSICEIMLQMPDLFCAILPELRPTVGFDQQTPYHVYDIYSHLAHSIEGVPKDPVLRLTMLLHDIGKPYCFRVDANQRGHFAGHAKVSEQIARGILLRLRTDRATLETICRLILHHDANIEATEADVKRYLAMLGERELRMLLRVKRADNAAHNPLFSGRTQQVAKVETILEKILREKQCYTLSQLAVNGDDLLALGLPAGKTIGQTLDDLLCRVIDGSLPNDKPTLLRYVKQNRN